VYVEEDDQEIVGRTRRKVKGAPYISLLTQPGPGKRKITFLEAYQIILQEQVKTLINDFNVGEELYTVRKQGQREGRHGRTTREREREEQEEREEEGTGSERINFLLGCWPLVVAICRNL
jgi:hypothetical protein